MKESLEKEIILINENLATLPKKLKKDKEKYLSYVSEQITKYGGLLEEASKEIECRYNNIVTDYNTGEDIEEISFDINKIRELNPKFSSYERMNLGYYFYLLNNTKDMDLKRVNSIILDILNVFKTCGVNLTSKDFSYTSEVNLYMKTLLLNDEEKEINIYDTFDKLYWATPNIIKEIQLNFYYLYLSKKKVLDKYYLSVNNENDFNSYLSNIISKNHEILNNKRNSRKYIFNKFLKKELNIGDFYEKNISATMDNILIEKDNSNNLDNLIKLDDTLYEYNNYLSFSYIIDSLKELFIKREEYKGLYDSKLKEITKEESKLFKLNKKLLNKGIFKLKEDKLNILQLEKGSIIDEISKLYSELDLLYIKELIYSKLSDKSSYYDLLYLATMDYNYFVSILSDQIDNFDMSIIEKYQYNLFKCVYRNEINIVNNYLINDDRDLVKMIIDRYLLVNVKVSEDNLDKDNIETFRTNVKNLIAYLSFSKINFSIKDMDLIFKYEKNFK